LKEISLKSEEKFVETSKRVKIEPDKTYSVGTTVAGYKGNLYIGYFGILIFNEQNREISRKIQWLNDFSGKEKFYQVIFTTPKNASHLRIVYRINDEVPITSNCKYFLLSVNQLKLHENANVKENFSVPEDFVIPRPKELTEFEEIELEKNLIWIFAAPRSGTSWLGTKLLSFNTKSINEPLIGLHLGVTRDRITKKVVREFDLFQKEPDYFFSKRYRNVWKYYLRKLILNRIFAQIQDISKKIIIKEPSGAISSDIIMECLPDSKCIFLVRDGRDVLDSRMDALQKDSWAVKKYGITPSSEKTRELDIKKSAKRWVRIIEIMKNTEIHLKENQFIKIRYENLRQNPIEELKKIYSFIGVNISDDMMGEIVDKFSFENMSQEEKGSGKIIRLASPGSWRKNFSEKEKEIMNEIMQEKLEEMGYSL
jgi:hypothetical protein